MRRINPAHIAYAHDIVMAAVAVGLSLFLRMGSSAWDLPASFIVSISGLFVVIAAAVFWPMGLYRGVWRYASMSDMVQITKAVTLVLLIFVPVMFVATRAEFVPRSFPVITWLVLLLLLGGPRFAYRLFRDRRIDWSIESGKRPRVPVLLIGAGDDAETFIRAISRQHNRNYRIVGVVDEKGHRTGRYIHTTPVLGSLAGIEDVLEDLKRRNSLPQRLIVTKQYLPREVMQRLFDLADAHGMVLSRLPVLTHFHNRAGDDSGDDETLKIRPVQVADLLGRPQNVLDRAAMRALVSGKRVLITGAGGTIGSELVRQIADLDPATLCLLDSGEFNLYTIDQQLTEAHPTLDSSAIVADVRDPARIAEVMTEIRANLVFHAAAMKHVTLVEANPTDGVLTNAVGTRIVADACRDYGVDVMVLISTDKAVNPTSIMGASKRAAESYCQALSVGREAAGTRYVTVRFGNVLGSTGSVVPLFQRQLAKGGPLTVTHPDVSRYFMTTHEAVELVLQATSSTVDTDHRDAIFILDMGEPVRIVDLANQMIRLANKRPDKDIEIEFIGLHPGEKLHEELFHAAEPLTPTAMRGIRLATPRTADQQLLSRLFDDLAAAARSGDRPTTLAVLSHIVPEYTPSANAAADHQSGRAAAAK